MWHVDLCPAQSWHMYWRMNNFVPDTGTTLSRLIVCYTVHIVATPTLPLFLTPTVFSYRAKFSTISNVLFSKKAHTNAQSGGFRVKPTLRPDSIATAHTAANSSNTVCFRIPRPCILCHASGHASGGPGAILLPAKPETWSNPWSWFWRRKLKT